jgi:hypothetical protein
MFEPPDPRDISGKTENFRIVDVVYHIFPIRRRHANSVCRCCVFLSLGTTIYNGGSRVSTRQSPLSSLSGPFTPLYGLETERVSNTRKVVVRSTRSS